ADESLHLACLNVSEPRCMCEKRSSNCLVVGNAATVRVHPAEAEHGFCIAAAGRVAVELRRTSLVLAHTFAMLVSARLGDEVRAIGRCWTSSGILCARASAQRERGKDACAAHASWHCQAFTCRPGHH